MPRYLLPVLCGLLAAPTAASAADLPYLDDRSGPAALVKSLYNAINRQEYARALAYFDERPAETIEQFADTFGDTERISVVTGNPLREEDQGQPDRFQLPLAIEFERADGETRVLAGCYTILGQSAVSEEDAFRPYRIESGLVEPVDVPFDEALPGRCGDGPELPDTDLLLERAKALFQKSFEETCTRDPFAEAEELEPERHTITYRFAYDDIDGPPREAHLFRFFCMRGAYNEIHVHLLADDTGELMPVSFVVPELDIRYEDEATMEEVRSIDVIGFTSRPELVNSEYDAETLTMTAHARWRGLGDASASGKWIFRSGAFTLVRYEVDASYDGEINPVTVIDLLAGP
jgi:hypothetical protein